jgi:hypothetical protein
MFHAERLRLFYRLIRPFVPAGAFLPWWARCLRFLFLPVETLGYFLTRPNHWDPLSDTFVIHGVRYSAAVFTELGFPVDRLYRFKKEGNVLTIQWVEGE